MNQAVQTQLGPYVLLELLGAGGFGQVFRARHGLMDRLVALKLIAPERLADPVFHQRFLKEVRATTKLQHPNIVLAFDAAEVDGQLYLAMELIDGPTLNQLVHERGVLSITLAVQMLLQTAQALKYAHDTGMVHRDIKPANLLVPQAGLQQYPGTDDAPVTLVKVVDFGLARLLPTPGAALSVTYKQRGGFVGTPDYVAPEQAQDPNDVDRRADLYSLGCTFYYALTGQKPFRGSNALEVVVQHLTQYAHPIENLRPDIPVALAAILRRLMEKNRDLRFSSADELITDLNRFLGKAAPPKLPMLFPAAPAAPPPSPKAGLTGSKSEAGYPTTAILPEMNPGATEIVTPAGPASMTAPANAESVNTTREESTQEKTPQELALSGSANSRPLREEKAIQDLPEFWLSWLGILELRIRGQAIHLAPSEYKTLHTRLIQGLHLLAFSDASRREPCRALAALVSPWLSLQVLLETDRATLEDLWQRCRERGNTVGLAARRNRWLMWTIVAGLLVNLLPFVIPLLEKRPDLSFRQRLSWLELTRFVEAYPVLCLSLFVPTAVLILFGIFKQCLRR